MQYDLTDNITSNTPNGAAIFGVFSDKSVKELAKSLSALDIAKIKETIKKSSFEGKANESLCDLIRNDWSICGYSKQRHVINTLWFNQYHNSGR